VSRCLGIDRQLAYDIHSGLVSVVWQAL
jgi:hypothetical protein